MSNDPCEAERGFNARTAMTSIRKLADFMAGVRGRRKTLLYISEGISYDTFDIFNNRSASIVNDEIRDAIAAATRANVAIYAIDPRGLAALADASIGGGVADDLPNADGNANARPIESAARGFANELQLAQMSLRTLAGETGGFAAVNRNDFADAFARIVRENSSYYVLGYYPANERRDGRFRKIEVRVKRPGLQVRSRQGYVAPRGRAPAQPRATAANAALGAANEAMSSPIPIGGLPITVFAAPFKGAAPNATVAIAVEIGIDNFKLTEGNGTINGRAEVTFATTDREGKPRGGGRHAVDLTLKPDTLAQTKQRGLRVVSQVDLPPGRYQLRVAVGEEGGACGQRAVRPRGARLLSRAADHERHRPDLRLRQADAVGAAEEPARRLPPWTSNHRARVQSRRRAGAVCRVLRKRAGRAAAPHGHHDHAARLDRPRS